MANYIHALQLQTLELKKQLQEIEAWKIRFIQHLASDKFKNTDVGERKDWIATQDVHSWLAQSPI